MVVTEYAKVQALLRRIAQAVPDQLDCDGCFELSAQFADAEMNGAALSQALQAVQIHLSQCPCCAYELETLVEAIQAADAKV